MQIYTGKNYIDNVFIPQHLAKLSWHPAKCSYGKETIDIWTIGGYKISSTYSGLLLLLEDEWFQHASYPGHLT